MRGRTQSRHSAIISSLCNNRVTLQSRYSRCCPSTQRLVSSAHSLVGQAKVSGNPALEISSCERLLETRGMTIENTDTLVFCGDGDPLDRKTVERLIGRALKLRRLCPSTGLEWATRRPQVGLERATTDGSHLPRGTRQVMGFPVRGTQQLKGFLVSRVRLHLRMASLSRCLRDAAASHSLRLCLRDAAASHSLNLCLGTSQGGLRVFSGGGAGQPVSLFVAKRLDGLS